MSSPEAATAPWAFAGIKISKDSRSRMMDNIFTERLWRNVKYEDIYLRQYETVPQLFHGLTDCFTLYKEFRPHQALNYATPSEVNFVQAGRI